jgi:hypothetical protein
VPHDLWGQPFRAQARETKYPFDDTATLVTDTNLSLPQDLFVDAKIALPNTWTLIGLTKVEITNNTIIFSFGNENEPALATATTAVPTTASLLIIRDVFNRVVGHVVIQPAVLEVLRTWPLGAHLFPADSANFVVSCVVPGVPRQFAGFYVGNTVFADDIYLLGSDGVVVTIKDNMLQIDVTGDPLFRRRACLAAGTAFVTPVFLRTINGIRPDDRGAFNLIVAPAAKGKTIARIDPRGNNTLLITAAGGDESSAKQVEIAMLDRV